MPNKKKKKRKPLSTLPAEYLAVALEASDDSQEDNPWKPKAKFAATPTVPADYFDTLEETIEETPLEEPSKAPRKKKSSARSTKARMAFSLPKELCQRVRDAAKQLSSPKKRMTFSALAQQALERELTRLERKHNDGKPFRKARSRRRQ